MQKGNVANLLRGLLGQAPSQVGLRLKSERELAGILGVNHYMIRTVLDDLLEAGFLMRRHGSGTYVRKVPKLPKAESTVLGQIRKTYALNLTTKDLFAQDVRDELSYVVPVDKKKLHLDLWSDYHACRGPKIANSILKGIEDRVVELGHVLITHSTVEKMDVPLSASAIAEQLSGSKSDGYMVVSRWASGFQEACEMVFGSQVPSLVYIQSHSSNMITHEPLIQIDVDEACSRAVHLLASEGFKKIGFLNYQIAFRKAEHQRKIYHRALEDAGLEFRASAFCEQDEASTLDALASLLDLSDRPEAIYVGDDNLLGVTCRELKSRGLKPMKDMGIITLSNVGSRLPKGYEWSCLEFNPEMIGTTAVDSLLRVIQTAGHEHSSISHQSSWRPGQTHKFFSKGLKNTVHGSPGLKTFETTPTNVPPKI